MGTAAGRASDVASVLNDLIETNRDGELGFKKAAEEAREPDLKGLFTKYSLQRAQNVTELQRAVAGLGEKPATSGSVTGTLHRGWMDVKTAVSKREDKALIEEAEAGEDAAVKNYQEALAKSLPPDVLSLIQRQFSGIQEAHNTIRDLKHGT